jgi:hypothetical protein
MQVAESSKWTHWSVGASGSAFVLLFLLATFAGGSELGGPDAPAGVIARDMTDRISGLPLNAALVGLSAVAGYLFIGGLHRTLSERSRSSAVWSALVGGVAMVTMVLATSTSAQAAILVDSLASDPQVAKTLWLLEHGSWALIGPPQMAFILGVSIVAIQEGYPSRWIGHTGLLVTVGLAANLVLGLGGLAGLGLLWVLALGLVMLFQPLPDMSSGPRG